MKSKFSRICLLIVILQLLLILLSWIVDAMQWYEVNSLLSPLGIRWFLSQYSYNIATPLMVWIVLAACAYGAVKKTFLNIENKKMKYQMRMARMVISIVALIIIGCIVLLTFVPQSLLMSSTGSLFPSPFSRSIVPIVSVSVMVLSWIYGSIMGTVTSLDDIVDSLVHGIRIGAPILLLYMLVAQLYCSLLFVFS
ncbi:MAG: AbgT family transporter [Prevotella sp.]|nr:AbgT family transporter [Candidatus Equicola stercoris]